jgi:hypothetical protein
MSVYYPSEFVLKEKKLSHYALLTPLNLPKGETSDATITLVAAPCSPPLEGLGEVKTSGNVAKFFLKTKN